MGLAGDKVQGTANYVNWGAKGEGSFTLNPGTFREPEKGGVKTFKGTGGDNFDVKPGAEKSFELPDDVS
jgi:hypothetical protein